MDSGAQLQASQCHIFFWAEHQVSGGRGHPSNGSKDILKNTIGLVPLGSVAFKKIAAEVKAGEYEESYKTTFNLKGALAIRKLSGLLTSNG